MPAWRLNQHQPPFSAELGAAGRKSHLHKRIGIADSAEGFRQRGCGPKSSPNKTQSWSHFCQPARLRRACPARRRRSPQWKGKGSPGQSHRRLRFFGLPPAPGAKCKGCPSTTACQKRPPPQKTQPRPRRKKNPRSAFFLCLSSLSLKVCGALFAM